MRSDTPVVWEWTSVEVLTGPIKTRGLGERQLHASKSTQLQKSCCLICVPLSPWQSETDNEEAPLLLLFCQKELEQSKRKGERRRWRCGELSQRHTHTRTHAELWICLLNPFFLLKGSDLFNRPLSLAFGKNGSSSKQGCFTLTTNHNTKDSWSGKNWDPRQSSRRNRFLRGNCTFHKK